MEELPEKVSSYVICLALWFKSKFFEIAAILDVALWGKMPAFIEEPG